MQAMRAMVRNGRLVLDEPTNLPEGAEVTVALMDGDELTDEERVALHQSLERGLADLEAGRVVDHARIKPQPRINRRRADTRPPRTKRAGHAERKLKPPAST